jgi:glycine dehydrogenase
VSAAPGSPSIVTISWVYIALMGRDGLTRATQMAILNANYGQAAETIPSSTRERPVRRARVYSRSSSIQRSAGVEVMDVAKRLMDYGFRSDGLVPGCRDAMIERKRIEAELDRFCEALVDSCRDARHRRGPPAAHNNLLKNAPPHGTGDDGQRMNRPYGVNGLPFLLPGTRP